MLEGVRKPVQHDKWNKQSCVAEWYPPTLDVEVNGAGTRCAVEWLTSLAGGRCAEGPSRTPGAMGVISGAAWHGGIPEWK